MSDAEKPARFARSQIVLHWTTLVLILISFFSHEAMGDAWRSLVRGGIADPGLGGWVHIGAGIAVLVLTVIRLGLRLRHGAPPPAAGQSPAITLASSIVHVAIYLMLLAIPLSGIAAWFGGLRDVGEVHEVLFNLTLGLVGLHVAAALYHQFVLKDRLLSRMW